MELRNQELDGIAKRAKLGLSIKTPKGREAREAAEVAKVAEAVEGLEAVKVAGDSPLSSLAVALVAASPPATARPMPAQPAAGVNPSVRRVIASGRTAASSTGKRGKLAASPGLLATKAARGTRAA